jgi:hypothetical protein
MARALAIRWFCRLFGGVLSVALVIASTVGAAAHANGHAHHAQHVHHAGPNVVDSADHGSRATNRESAQVRSSDDGDIDPRLPEPKRSNCPDCCCHGGVAVLAAAGWDSTSWSEARLSPWTSRVLASVGQTRLDRPPKSFVSA